MDKADLFRQRPSDLTAFGTQVFDVLSHFTSFPGPILLAQCQRANIESSSLQPSDLVALIDLLETAVVQFTSPEKGRALRQELQALSRPAS